MELDVVKISKSLEQIRQTGFALDKLMAEVDITVSYEVTRGLLLVGNVNFTHPFTVYLDQPMSVVSIRLGRDGRPMLKVKRLIGSMDVTLAELSLGDKFNVLNELNRVVVAVTSAKEFSQEEVSVAVAKK